MDPMHEKLCFASLSFEQLKRLEEVMNKEFPIHGRGNFPSLDIKLKHLVLAVRNRLKNNHVEVHDVRLNGSAASHVLARDSNQHQFNDVDLIFRVNLCAPNKFDHIKTSVFESLLDLLPPGVSKKRMSPCSLGEAYVYKMVKVSPVDTCNNNNGSIDKWSLISLSNARGRNVEMKFVDTMRRQFEFSVDSFQIIIDPLLSEGETDRNGDENYKLNEYNYPNILGESLYGDFNSALSHLNGRLIATMNPEEIRGGGLLKYCSLLNRGYKPAEPRRIKMLERYMCSRFFIDFPDITQQQAKLETYLLNHFVDEDSQYLKFEYLMTLYRVVDESTVCLMGHERRQTLALIDELACSVFWHHQQARYAKHHGLNMSCGAPFYRTYIITSYSPDNSCSCTWMPAC